MRALVCTILLVVSLAWATSGCRQQEAEQVFTVRGVVLSPAADGEIVIEHEEIPGFMPAMTMPFFLQDPTAADVKDLRPGDVVQFQFRVGSDSRAHSFQVLRRGAPPRPAQSPSPAAPTARAPRLQPGEPLPPISLVDQHGAPLTREQLAGSYTVLTFIFTRCPVPEFCPRVSAEFQRLQSRLAAQTTLPPTRLLSITIDPEHDRPDVLRTYGERYGADPERWVFATGDTKEIDRLRQAFGLFAERNATTIDHTLATALLGPDLRLIEVWRGRDGSADQVVSAIEAAGASVPASPSAPSTSGAP